MIGPVRTRKTFGAFRTDGIRVRSGSVRMSFVRAETVEMTGPVQFQLAFAVTKHFGNAVERNRARRRLKHGFPQAVSRFPVSFTVPVGAVLLSPRPSVLTDQFDYVVDSLADCLQQLRTKGVL